MIVYLDESGDLGWILDKPFNQGELHCATVDVNREGDCKDYFPKQIKRY